MIRVGQILPDVKVYVLKDGQPASVRVHEIFAAKRAVLFGIPAAFSPGCSNTHCPSYIRAFTLTEGRGVFFSGLAEDSLCFLTSSTLDAERLRKAGFEMVAMTSVNDAWTLDAFAKHMKIGDAFVMLADGNADLALALGLSKDLSAAGAGVVRSRRYALVVDNLIVRHIALDNMEDVTAAAILKAKL